MPVQWLNFDNWEGGGFFADGSYDAAGRFQALNMQRYSNGSIGPRPQWRKLTQTADAASSVPSILNASKNSLLQGVGFAPYGPASWSYGVILLLTDTVVSAGGARRIRVKNDGTCEYFAASDRLGYDHTSALQLRHPTEPYRINAVQVRYDGVLPIWIGANTLYNPSTNVANTIGVRTVAAASFYVRKAVLYQGRTYAWQASNTSHTSLESIIYSTPLDSTDFNGTDSGDFKISTGYVAGSNPPSIPRGMWALPSGLLIFSSEGPVRQSTLYTGVTEPWSDHGRWDILSGRNIQVGSIRQLSHDTGPLYHSLTVVYDGKVMFPIYQRGWAVHDGNALDKSSLQALRPGRGAFATFSTWYAPVVTDLKPMLMLPFLTTATDPTADGSSTTDRIGEFYNLGYGAFEFVNGAWTESLYLHGQGDLVGYGKLEEDKMFMVHLDSANAGTNWFPQVYIRDVTLDRPSVVAAQANTYNPFSDSTETAPTQAGGATGHMVCRLETGERMAPNGMQYEVSQIVIDYDYWNSSLFDTTCGFDVDLIIRGMRDADKLVQRVTIERVTPPATSLEHYPKRARKIITLDKRIAGGSFQIRLDNVVGCAVHAINAAVTEVKAY